jgi:hypothetical protein
LVLSFAWASQAWRMRQPWLSSWSRMEWNLLNCAGVLEALAWVP